MSRPISEHLYGGSDVKTFTLRCSPSVRLYGPEIEIVDTEEFQRLDGLRQLGTAHLVFRSANHTRLEHCIGTLHEAQHIIDAVNANPRGHVTIDETGQRLCRLFALLHDLTHVPYGHTLEDEFLLLERHDGNHARRRRLLDDASIGSILRRALGDRKLPGGRTEHELLMAVLTEGEAAAAALGPYAYVIDLVTNTVCADALDYVPRDLTACGMPVAIGDRFLDYFVLAPDTHPDFKHCYRMALRLDKRGMPRPDVESEVHKLLEHRYELVERVFFHHGKNAASAMLARAIQELGLAKHEENFDHLSDETLRLVLRRPELAGPLGLTLHSDPVRAALAARLATDTHHRRLYKLAYLGVPDEDVARHAKRIFAEHCKSASTRAAAEDELAGLCGLQPGEVLIHIPNPRMLKKEGNVRVMLDNGDVVFLHEWDKERSGRVEALARAHERLWRVCVYAHPSAGEQELRLLSSAAEQRFGLRPRYVNQAPPDRYLGELFDQHAEVREWPAHLRTVAIAGALQAAANAQSDGRNVSRTRDAMLDLLDVAVTRLTAQEQRAMGQAGLFEGDG